MGKNVEIYAALRDFLQEVPNWNSDQDIRSKFQYFRSSRDVDPQLWDENINFWSDVILRGTLHARVYCCSIDELMEMFSRIFVEEGRLAPDLSVVVHDLIRRGEVVSLYQYMAFYEPGFLGRAYSYINSFFYDPPEVDNGERLVFLKNIEAECDLIVRQVQSKGVDIVDFIIPVEDVLKNYNRIELEVVASALEHTDKAKFVRYGATACLKFKCPGAESFFDENLKFDELIIKVKNGVRVLTTLIERIEDEISSSNVRIREQIKKRKKTMALRALRLKKSLEKLLEEKSEALQHLKMILLQINSQYSNTQYVDAIKSGTELLQSLQEELSVEEIDEVYLNAAEAIEAQRVYSEAILEAGEEIGGSGIDEQELEDELEKLCVEEYEMKISELEKPPENEIDHYDDDDQTKYEPEVEESGSDISEGREAIIVA